MHGHTKKYNLYVAAVMPDHVHLILTPLIDFEHPRCRSLLLRQQRLDFGDQMAQVKRLGQDPRPVRRQAVVLQRDRGKPGDEHDADAGLARRHPPRQLDPVDPGHHHIGEQEVEFGVARALERLLAIGNRLDRVARPAQPARPPGMGAL